MFNKIKNTFMALFEALREAGQELRTGGFKTFEEFYEEMEPTVIKKYALRDLYIWGHYYDQKPNFLRSKYAKTSKSGKKYFDVPLNKVPKGYPQERKIVYRRVSESTRPASYHSPMIGIRATLPGEEDWIFNGNLHQILERRRKEREEEDSKFFFS